MHKRLKDISELVKYIIAIQVVVVIGFCTMKGLAIQKEFWSIAGSILTYIFMSYTPKLDNIVSKSNLGGIFKGIIAIGLFGVISYCTAKNIEIGKEFWGITGGVITFIFNSKNKE